MSKPSTRATRIVAIPISTDNDLVRGRAVVADDADRDPHHAGEGNEREPAGRRDGCRRLVGSLGKPAAPRQVHEHQQQDGGAESTGE
jgi:hypothetical protein